MKKKMISTLTAVAICATCMGASPAPNELARANADTVTIGVAKDMSDLNILTDTEYSYENQWVYTMIYDRLFSIGDNGKFVPELAEECVVDVNGYSFYMFYDDEFYFNQNDPNTQSRKKKRSDIGFPYPGWFDDFYGDPYGLDGYFFERGHGSPLVLRFTLRDDVRYVDGDSLDAYKVQEYIEFCQMQPKNTVVNRLWSHAYDVQATSYSELEISFDLSDYSYGLMDFLYELASPYGSILNPYVDNNNGGTGAYYIYGRDGDLTLARHEDWWSSSVNTPIVRFVYTTPHNYVEDADIMYVPDYLHDGKLVSSYGYEDVRFVSGNPLVLLFNPESENLKQVEMRQALTLAAGCDTVKKINQDYILSESNGYWGYTDVKQDQAKALDFLSQVEFYWVGYDEVSLEIIFCNDEFNYTQYAAELIQNAMSSMDPRVHVKICEMSKARYAAALQSGNYDMALSFIDLNDPDSEYNTFYPTVDDHLNEHLDHAILSATLGTYRAMQSDNQYLALLNHLLVNYGWKAEAFAQINGISGVDYVSFNPVPNWKLPQKYALSDANLVDFRWVTKQL